MYEVNYTKKPSITTLGAAIKKAVNQGETFIQLIWGENQITIERMGANGHWIGSGWIGRHGGADLASKLNVRAAFNHRMGDPVQFLRDHVQVIHIGGPK
jgi:hypothetical protein